MVREVRGLAFLCYPFRTTLPTCWLYLEAGGQVTSNSRLQRKRESISSCGSLESEETSFLKALANLPSHISVPMVTILYLNQLLGQGMTWIAWLRLGS